MQTKHYALILILLLWGSTALAAGTQYHLRVDGLACPFCAYGIEKQFSNTNGVDSVDIKLQDGLVIVSTAEGKQFTEEQLKIIVNDTGFTLKSMTQKAR